MLNRFALFIKSLALRIFPESVLTHVKKVHYRRVLARFQEGDEPDLAVVKELVKSGDTVFDVGANLGVYTRFLSEYVGANGQVHSFEPIPPTAEYLTSNIHALGLKNVYIHSVALSDNVGEETMVVPKYAAGGSNFYQASLLKSSNEDFGQSEQLLEFEVRTEILDNIWKSIHTQISFIKIDVEGAELACLHGAKECLTINRPALLIEVSGNLGDEGSRAGELKLLLEELGYSIYCLQQNILVPWVAGLKSVNYFFLQPRHLDFIKRVRLSS